MFVVGIATYLTYEFKSYTHDSQAWIIGPGIVIYLLTTDKYYYNNIE